MDRGYATENSKISTDNALENMRVRVVSMNEHASMIQDRLQRVLDRAFGGQPEKDSPQNPRPVPNGSISAVNEQHEILSTRLDSITNLLNRVDSIV